MFQHYVTKDPTDVGGAEVTRVPARRRRSKGNPARHKGRTLPAHIARLNLEARRG